MSRLRKVIAERAVISMQTSAQLTSVVEVDVTRVAHFRDDVKDQFLRETGVKLSFLPFFALAAWLFAPGSWPRFAASLLAAALAAGALVGRYWHPFRSFFRTAPAVPDGVAQ